MALTLSSDPTAHWLWSRLYGGIVKGTSVSGTRTVALASAAPRLDDNLGSVLILGMNYAPEVTGIGPFTAGLAQHLADTGYRVTVSTTFPHYPDWKVQAPYVGRWRALERVHGVDVRRIKVIVPRRPSLLGRLVYDSSLATGALLNAIGSRPQLLISVSPPVQLGVAGGLLARAWRVPHLLVLEDLALAAGVAVGMVRSRWLKETGSFLERISYRLAHRIVVISQGFTDSLTRNGVSPSRVIVIPHWAKFDPLEQPGGGEVRAELGAAEGDLLVLHIGNLGKKQDLMTPIAAAALCSETQAFKLALVGEGSEKASLARAIEGTRVRNVRILPLQSESRLPSILAAADICLLSQMADVTDSVAPSKLLRYMGAGRPIIAAVHTDSEAARLVRQAKCGLVIQPEAPIELIQAVEILRASAATRSELGDAGRAFALANFDKTNVLTRWQELVKSSLIDPLVRLQ